MHQVFFKKWSIYKIGLESELAKNLKKKRLKSSNKYGSHFKVLAPPEFFYISMNDIQ